MHSNPMMTTALRTFKRDGTIVYCGEYGADEDDDRHPGAHECETCSKIFCDQHIAAAVEGAGKRCAPCAAAAVDLRRC